MAINVSVQSGYAPLTHTNTGVKVSGQTAYAALIPEQGLSVSVQTAYVVLTTDARVEVAVQAAYVVLTGPPTAARRRQGGVVN